MEKKIENNIDNLVKIHIKIKKEIENRLKEFKELWQNATEHELFGELVFCILTPQSKATTCWEAVKRLKEKELLFSNNNKQISETIHPVRFKNNKAKYIIEAKTKFSSNNGFSLRSVLNNFSTNIDKRSWLFENIKGIGLKEASHFLRNIGFGDNLAILDRHILKNMVIYGVIEEIPKSISLVKYLEIEKKLLEFSLKLDIDPQHLDFVLWYKEAGEVFK